MSPRCRGRGRRAHAQAVEPRQGAVPRGRVHQGRSHRLLRPDRARDAAPTSATGASPCAGSRMASTPGRSSRSAARRTGRTGSARAPGPGDRGGAIDYCRLADLRQPRVGGQPGRARDPRADGPSRRHRRPGDGRVRPRSRCARRRCASAPRSGCWIRDVLDGIGLEGLAKTSGSKGMQLYVPVNRPGSPTRGRRRSPSRWRRRWRSTTPDKVVSNMRKDLRGGKVFIDWSQNSRHKTTVAVYSLRARPRPTVSTPVTWDEVADGGRRRPADVRGIHGAGASRRVR